MHPASQMESIMKLAILADIHGNLPAFRVVTDHIERWKPDAVLLAGDVVNRPPLVYLSSLITLKNTSTTCGSKCFPLSACMYSRAFSFGQLAR